MYIEKLIYLPQLNLNYKIKQGEKNYLFKVVCLICLKYKDYESLLKLFSLISFINQFKLIDYRNI